MNTLNYIGDYLGHFGFFAWVLLIGALAGAIWKIRGTRGRTVAIVIILGLFAAFPGRWAWEVQQRVDHYRTAEAMFQERCKKSGEFIHRTAENVEGVLLLKIREQTSRGDQYKMDDPYGHDSADDEYLKSFLYGRNEKGSLIVDGPVASKGYRYVDALDRNDGKRYRYMGGMKAVGKKDTTAYNVKLALSKDPDYDLNVYMYVLDKTPAPNPPPRYGVTYDDISTREERDYWIAGSSLKVVDLKTNEVMAERIGYMMDRGQGNNSGGRSPWLLAASYACPSFIPPGGRQPGFSYQGGQTRDFVKKILKPIQER